MCSTYKGRFADVGWYFKDQILPSAIVMRREEGMNDQVAHKCSAHLVLLSELEQLLALGFGQKFEKVGDGDNGRWPGGAVVGVFICEWGDQWFDVFE